MRNNMISLRTSPRRNKNGVTALEAVSIEIEKGEFVFVGSVRLRQVTTLRLLLREEEPSTASVRARKNVRAAPLPGGADGASWTCLSRTTHDEDELALLDLDPRPLSRAVTPFLYVLVTFWS